ncbi:MAG: hypothetical protein K1X51_08540, partial [Rhodospirillaceae bacterium]|nr:hypothetical protein [Rhodospirillaceae bacterium]
MDTGQWKILTLEENPERHEQVITAQQNDPAAAIQKLLQSIYLEKDRDSAFARFARGLEFRTIRKILDTFGVGRDARILEIGGGAGFLAWA